MAQPAPSTVKFQTLYDRILAKPLAARSGRFLSLNISSKT